MKALEHYSLCLVYIGKNISGVSPEKLKGGIKDGPQLGQFISDLHLVESIWIMWAKTIVDICSYCQEFSGLLQS